MCLRMNVCIADILCHVKNDEWYFDEKCKHEKMTLAVKINLGSITFVIVAYI